MTGIRESRVRIIDDGKGMSESELVNAMTLGSKSPLEDRDPEDLGDSDSGSRLLLSPSANC